jgi:hypothetical protein
MFFQPPQIVLGLHILVAATVSGVPTVDIAKTCRASEKAIADTFGSGTVATFDNCMQQEGDARAQIIKNWANYPVAGRQRCINPRAYMPSYVEWLTCLELERDVRELRKTNPPDNPKSK